jgi:hypothetical protein
MWHKSTCDEIFLMIYFFKFFRNFPFRISNVVYQNDCLISFIERCVVFEEKFDKDK